MALSINFNQFSNWAVLKIPHWIIIIRNILDSTGLVNVDFPIGLSESPIQWVAKNPQTNHQPCFFFFNYFNIPICFMVKTQ